MTSPVVADGVAAYTPGVSRTASSTMTFAHAGLKNTNTQSAENQTVGANRVYDAFGNVVSSSGTWSGPFGYAGNFGYQEDLSGLKLLGYREYDPVVGRFLTQDPIAVRRNWYCYVRRFPLSEADPTGLQSMPAQLILARDAAEKRILFNLNRIHAYAASIVKSPDEYNFRNDRKWNGDDIRNTDCGVFVSECARQYDPGLPVSGTGNTYNYLSKSSRWQVRELDDDYVPEPGEIIILTSTQARAMGYDRSVGHTAIISDSNKEFSASLGNATTGRTPSERNTGLQWWRDHGGKAFRPANLDAADVMHPG